jgi:hypothetical protein
MRDPAVTFARELAGGAIVLGPTGRDITTAVRAAFHRTLPACGGNHAAAASQAVASALAATNREDSL